MAISQAYGALVITTGTTANAEVLFRSANSVKAASLLRWRDMMSQRILNSTMIVELADLIGPGLAFTTSSDGLSISVTGTGFTSANIGQWVSLGGVQGVATSVPGRYAITAVSGDVTTFSAIAQCTWTRSTTTATVTMLGGGFSPIYIAETTAAVTNSLDGSGASATAAIANGTVTIATQSSTAGVGSVLTFTCLNAGPTSGTLTLQRSDAWTGSGAGTLTVFGWNLLSISYHTALNTTAWIDAFKNGWGIGASSVTVTGSAATQVVAIQTDNSLADVTTTANTSSTGFLGTSRGSRLSCVPAEDTVLYAFIRVFNGTTAPLSTTTCNFGEATIEELGNLKVQIAGAVQNGSARSLKADVTGSLTTLSTVTNSQTGLPVLVADIASGVISSSGNGSTITPATGCSYSYNIPVTAIGSSGILDWIIQESADSGTSWFDVFHFPRITASGATYYSPKLPLTGNRVRINRSLVSGTSQTCSVNRLQCSDSARPFRQFYDRTANVLNGTVSTPTASFRFDGCTNLNARVVLGAASVPATYQWQISGDNANWSNVGTPTAAAASTATNISVTGVATMWGRLIVTSGATSQTGTHIELTGNA